MANDGEFAGVMDNLLAEFQTERLMPISHISFLVFKRGIYT